MIFVLNWNISVAAFHRLFEIADGKNKQWRSFSREGGLSAYEIIFTGKIVEKYAVVTFLYGDVVASLFGYTVG